MNPRKTTPEGPEVRHFYVGIDPGKTGGYGIIDQEGTHLGCGSMGDFLRGEHKALPIMSTFVIIEHQQVRHEDKKSELFNLQHLFINYGEWRGILKAMDLKFSQVEAWAWQSDFGLTFPRGFRNTHRGQLKIIKSDMILTLARTLFPGCGLEKRKDDGMAAALLIAEYGRQISFGKMLKEAP